MRRRHTKFRFQKAFVVTSAHYIEVLEQFSSYVISKGYTENYGKQQVECLREFFWKMEEKEVANIQIIKSDQIRQYHKYLSNRKNRVREGGLSNRMIEHHVNAIKNCFNFLQQDLILQDNPFTVLRFKKHLAKPRKGLTQEQVQELYKASKTKREITLLHLFYACGLRRSEAVALNLNDVHIEKKLLIVREGKFGKRRMVPLQSSVAKDIQDYIQHERPNCLKANTIEKEALLLSNIGQRLIGNHANRMLKLIAIRLPKKTQKEIGSVYPHLLRHSIATHLINNGMNMEELSEYLGHSSLDSTQVYIYGSGHYLRNQYKQKRQINAEEYRKH